MSRTPEKKSTMTKVFPVSQKEKFSLNSKRGSSVLGDRRISTLNSNSEVPTNFSLKNNLQAEEFKRQESMLLLIQDERRLITEEERLDLDQDYQHVILPILQTDKAPQGFASNKIRTALYSRLTIFPVAFMLQFTKIANVYWGICTVL